MQGLAHREGGVRPEVRPPCPDVMPLQRSTSPHSGHPHIMLNYTHPTPFCVYPSNIPKRRSRAPPHERPTRCFAAHECTPRSVLRASDSIAHGRTPHAPRTELHVPGVC
eukprot:1021223-Prymnesium_polylepis.1